MANALLSTHLDVEGNKGRNAVGVGLTGQGFDHINYLPTHLAVLALNTGEGTSTIIVRITVSIES